MTVIPNFSLYVWCHEDEDGRFVPAIVSDGVNVVAAVEARYYEATRMAPEMQKRADALGKPVHLLEFVQKENSRTHSVRPPLQTLAPRDATARPVADVTFAIVLDEPAHADWDGWVPVIVLAHPDAGLDSTYVEGQMEDSSDEEFAEDVGAPRYIVIECPPLKGKSE